MSNLLYEVTTLLFLFYSYVIVASFHFIQGLEPTHTKMEVHDIGARSIIAVSGSSIQRWNP